MIHRGEIIQKAVKDSGYSVSKLAERLGRSRRWMYHVFENPMVNIELVAEIGSIIHYDFSEEIKQLRTYQQDNARELVQEPAGEYGTGKKTAEYWKNKYLNLLEKYNNLLSKSRPVKITPKKGTKPRKKSR